MIARPTARTRWRNALSVAVAALLLVPILALLGSPPAYAIGKENCFTSSPTQVCLNGTIETEKGPLAGVKLTITGPGGSGSATTAEDGSWKFTATQPGSYTVAIDESSLPKGLEVKTAKRTLPNLKAGAKQPVNLEVRTSSYSASEPRSTQILKGLSEGLVFGLLLALASLGLSLIYGTTGLSNFAHAEQFTLGGFIGWWAHSHGLPLIGTIGILLTGIVVVVFCGATGWVQDWLIWKPLRRRGLGLTQLMIVTIGLSLAMQYVFQFAVGTDNQKVDTAIHELHQYGPLYFTGPDLVAIAISVVLLLLIGFGLLRTRIGRATRAISDNPGLASASGIDVDSVIRLVWTVAMALAGLAGLLYSLSVSNGIRWDTGSQILLLLFAAVTLGGLGTAFGALIGSMIIGMVVSLCPAFGVPGNLKYAAALAILILLLLFRPQGLLGRAQRVG